MKKNIELSADDPKALKGSTSLSSSSGFSGNRFPELWKKKRSKLPWEKSKKTDPK
jgi:hypothetical protein